LRHQLHAVVGDEYALHIQLHAGLAVRVEEVDAAYWRARFNGARRLLLPDTATEPAVR
jgi:hypothetical protein